MLSKKRLPDQKEYEKMVYFLRRHWIIFIRTVIFHTLIALAPLVLYLLFRENIVEYMKGPILNPIIILSVSAYYLFVWVFFFHSFIDFYLDVWIVTNDRIVDIEQQGMFARTISELKLYQVQDVTSEIKGVFATAFHYGTIYVQTAGERQRFEFQNIPDPYRVAKKILELAEIDRDYHEGRRK